MARLRTRAARSRADVRAFFDGIAANYGEAHGSAGALLEYRLGLIRRLIAPAMGGVLLDIGCGPGVHLFPLAGAFRHAIGVDLSPAMIAAAEGTRARHGDAAHVELYAEPAECLSSIEDASADAVICVGAFEHMPDKLAVLCEARRVMNRGGRLAVLTVNGNCLWYRWLAPWLRYDVRHLSSDRYVDESGARAMLRQAGLRVAEMGYWRFVPRGDMPAWAACALQSLDPVGSLCLPSALRGGLYFAAERTGER